MDSNIAKESFYNDSDLFFQEGILREIYSTDTFSICNVANHNYAFFPFSTSESRLFTSKKEGHLGIFISINFLRKVLNDNSNLANLALIDKANMKKLSFRLNDKNYIALKQLKEKTDLNGPSSEIDLAMEAKLLNSKKRN